MIYCAHCGSPNDDNAFRCVQCEKVIRRPDGHGVRAEDDIESPTYLVWSILVTIFCCQITGIPAIVYSAIAMSKNSSFEFAAARKASRTAATWCWVSFGIGMLWILTYGGMVIMGLMAANNATP